MTSIRLEYSILYAGVLIILLFLFFAAMGGGLMESETFWMTDWQHRLFSQFCHQDPTRSFTVNGTPMAVCSRCFGIYTGLAVAWSVLPFINIFSDLKYPYAKQLLLGAVCLNLLDLIGNFAGIWQNTLVSRFIMGNLIGVAAVVLLAGGLVVKKIRLYREQLETKS